MRYFTGIYRTIEGVEDTVKALLDNGFTDDDIGVVTRDTQKGTVIADDLGREYASGATPDEANLLSRSSVWDRYPREYDETLRRDGMAEEAITRCTMRLEEGDVLLVVDAHDRGDSDVMRIMRDHEGEPCWAQAEKTAVPREVAGTEYRMPVIEEEIAVEKVQRETGEVCITTETTQRNVDVPTVLTHEEIRVERRKLERPLSPDEYKGSKLTEGELCMPIVEEEVRVVKHPVIREEIVVTRVPVTEQQTMRETVTRTQPHVETTGEVDLRGDVKKRKGKAA